MSYYGIRIAHVNENKTRFFKIGIGAGYRYATDIKKFPGLGDKNLKGVSGRLSFYFGWFLIKKKVWLMTTKNGHPVAGDIVQQPARIIREIIGDAAVYPNNDDLPVLIYKNALLLPDKQPGALVEELFNQNRWENSWNNGIFGYHHYHSTAHEVLGIYSGEARILLGGPDGMSLTVKKGDVILLPAGVAHKNLGSSSDFGCVGAYPAGQDFDINLGEPEERKKADRQIARVPLPMTDPVYGQEGHLLSEWT